MSPPKDPLVELIESFKGMRYTEQNRALFEEAIHRHMQLRTTLPPLDLPVMEWTPPTELPPVDLEAERRHRLLSYGPPVIEYPWYGRLTMAMDEAAGEQLHDLAELYIFDRVCPSCGEEATLDPHDCPYEGGDPVAASRLRR